MKMSVELTLAPPQDDFESPIVDFIKRLKNSDLTVLENPLSTQVHGDYDRVMELLKTEIKETFENADRAILRIKVVKHGQS